MFDLTHASLEVCKAAALQGVRSGEVEFISSPGPGNTEAGIMAYVHNRYTSIAITSRDAEEAGGYTWYPPHAQPLMGTEV